MSRDFSTFFSFEKKTQDGAVKVYDRFLEARAKGQGLNFHADGAFGYYKPGKLCGKFVEKVRP